MEMRTNNILVFGSSGQTGSYLVKNALENGFDVRVFVRNPKKLSDRLDFLGVSERNLDHLEVVKGDLTDLEAVRESVRGMNYVVSVAGGPHSNKKYVNGFMERFVVAVVSGCRKYNCNRFLFQAGAFSPYPGHPLNRTAKFMRSVMAPLMGISSMLKDNDEVVKYLFSKCDDIEWTVTRPGMLKDGTSKGMVKSGDKMPMGSIRFVDLAIYTLKELVHEDGIYVHKCPYPVYKK